MINSRLVITLLLRRLPRMKMSYVCHVPPDARIQEIGSKTHPFGQFTEHFEECERMDSDVTRIFASAVPDLSRP